MNTTEYHNLFEQIISGEYNQPPYDNEFYTKYVKLNHSRTKRWTKQGELNPEMIAAVQSIQEAQHWVLITEPWCGDAANSVPFIEKMAALNPKIRLEIQLRDSGSEIESYLTNGGKAIPKLIVRDTEGKDLFNWGPRPREAQELVLKQKESTATMDEKYAEILLWYKEDDGKSLQAELLKLLKSN